jgi:hypothetical protein
VNYGGFDGRKDSRYKVNVTTTQSI